MGRFSAPTPLPTFTSDEKRAIRRRRGRAHVERKSDRRRQKAGAARPGEGALPQDECVRHVNRHKRVRDVQTRPRLDPSSGSVAAFSIALHPAPVGQTTADGNRRASARGGGTVGRNATAEREQRNAGTVPTMFQSSVQVSGATEGTTAPVVTHSVAIPWHLKARKPCRSVVLPFARQSAAGPSAVSPPHGSAALWQHEWAAG